MRARSSAPTHSQPKFKGLAFLVASRCGSIQVCRSSRSVRQLLVGEVPPGWFSSPLTSSERRVRTR